MSFPVMLCDVHIESKRKISFYDSISDSQDKHDAWSTGNPDM
jgi:hypothetical protein